MSEIQYEVRERDLLAFNEHLAWAGEGLKKHMRRHQSQVPGFIVLLSLLLWFYYKDSLSAIYVASVALLWGFGVPGYLRWNLRRQIRKSYTDEDLQQILGRITLRVDKHDLVEITEGGESRTPWAEVLRIEATRAYAFIFVGPQAALIIPRATVKQGDLHQFIRAADERISQAEGE